MISCVNGTIGIVTVEQSRIGWIGSLNICVVLEHSRVINAGCDRNPCDDTEIGNQNWTLLTVSHLD